MNELQHFLNSSRCVTIPNKRNEECNYLVRDNFLSEYVTSEDKLKVLDNLGILRYLQNIQDSINRSLNYCVSLNYLEQNFVKKKDVYFPYTGLDTSIDLINTDDQEGSGGNSNRGGQSEGSGNGDGQSGNSNSSVVGNIINIDNELSLISVNPVQNRIITQALIEKADTTILEQYTKFVDLVSYLKPYQKELNAGNGIVIDKDTNTISVTLDINPFVVVDDYPQGNDINPNKIYIIKRGGYYIQYKYTPNGWIELGRDYSLNIDMSGYYTKGESDNKYMLKSQYSDIEQFVQTYVTGILGQYIKKSDVYTPYYGNEDTNPSGSSSSGGNSGDKVSYNIVIDSILSSLSDNPVKNKVIFEEFQKKADLADIQRDYVTKNYLSQTLLNYNLQGELKTINGQTIIGTGNIQIDLETDNELSVLSTKPIQNRVVKIALDNKVSNSDFQQAIDSKQNVLTAGNGISISGNIISASIDTNPFVIVDTLPLIGETSKIYLVKNGQYYDHYIYTLENGWENRGTVDFSVDLDNYLKSSDAYSNFVTKSSLETLVDTLVTKSSLTTQFQNYADQVSNVLDTFVTKSSLATQLGNYITQSYVLERFVTNLSLETQLENYATKAYVLETFSTNQQLNELVEYVNQTFARKGESPSEPSPSTGYTPTISIDSTLSAFSDNPVKNSVIYDEFQKKIDASVVQNDYVTKTQLTQTLVDYNLQGKVKTINGQTLIGTGNIQIGLEVDDELSVLSTNPVQNNVIKAALDTKVNSSDFQQAIDSKQNTLTAGYGIRINNNTISVSVDVNPFTIVDYPPIIGDISKIYLVKNGQQYDQYVYTTDNGWENRGSIDFSIDLTNYMQSSEIYENFVTISSLTTQLGNYATKDYALETFITKADANFSTSQQLTELRNYVNQTFIKKADIYTESDGSSIDPSGGGQSSGITVNNKYNSSISNGTRTNVTVGNIIQGTDIASLKDLSFTELFDMMLFKEIWPVANYEHNISLGILPTVVKVGDPVVQPTIQATWNNNILPLNEITYNLVQSVQGDTYENVGTETFTLNYSYPAGTYVITSNYGNTREIEKQAKQGTMVRTVKVTYPWYLNNVEQSVLVPINTDYTLQVALTGAPSIAIPGQSSSCQIQANLGLGYMDVTNWTRSITEKNGITYSVWTKPDAYLQNVEHKITFNISL